MTTPKPPTPQGISALLKRAGFERSESSATRIKGWRKSSEGYSASKWDDDGSVEVTWHRGLLSPSEADEERPRMLVAYTETITAAGYSVRLQSNDRLIVTAGKAEQ